MTSSDPEDNATDNKRTSHQWWSLTINLPTALDDHPEEDQYEYLEDRIERLHEMYAAGQVNYAVGSYELGDQGRLHVQAMCSVNPTCRAKWIRGKLDGYHVEAMHEKSTPKKLREYCTKGRTHIKAAFEFGHWGVSLVTKKGISKKDKKPKLDVVYEYIDNDLLNTMEEIEDFDPTTFARNRQAIRRKLDRKQDLIVLERERARLATQAMRCWQHWLFRYLNEIEPGNRHMLFVSDKIGGAGKSEFIKYYELFGRRKCDTLEVSKKADMICALDTLNTEVVFIDVTRIQLEYMDHLYPFAESVKNGRILNSKFDSYTRRLFNAHVVIFMNDDPSIGFRPSGKRMWNDVRDRWEETLSEPPLSADRYLVLRLDSSLNDLWSPDHKYYGSKCPEFKTYRDRGVGSEFGSGTPYRPPLVEDHGPAFSSDNAGDGPTKWTDISPEYMMTYTDLETPRRQAFTFERDSTDVGYTNPQPRDFPNYERYEEYLWLRWGKHVHTLRTAEVFKELKKVKPVFKQG